MKRRTENVLVTVLTYSAGSQSHAILEMVLRGGIQKPDPFIVVNADPGMENSNTRALAKESRRRCEDAGIGFIVAPGPDLLLDLITAKVRGATRLDHPPLFVKKPDGKRGQISQRCTYFYKIAPMDRAVRVWLEENLGITRKSPAVSRYGVVVKWLGFSADEAHRIRPPQQQYIRLAYPLVELGMTKEDVARWYHANRIPQPDRSVCNACFANSPGFYRKMRDERPHDFAHAVAVDAAIRDMSQFGITQGPAFFSDRLVPIEEAAEMADDPGFESRAEAASCDSGHCFA